MIVIVPVVMFQIEQVCYQSRRMNLEHLEEVPLAEQRERDHGQRVVLGELVDFEDVGSPVVESLHVHCDLSCTIHSVLGDMAVV